MALSAQSVHSLNPKNTELQPHNKIDIHGVARGSCKNCTECPQFISIPGHVLCAYCGCPPARHHKEDPGGLLGSREDMSVPDRRRRDTGSTRSESITSREEESAEESDSTSSGVSSYASRSRRRRRGWRPAWQQTSAPPRVSRLLEEQENKQTNEEEAADRALQLENTWNECDCSPNIYVRPDDPLTLHRNPVYQTTDAIRGKSGYTTGLHIWEVTWPQSSRGTHPVVGVAHKTAPLSEPGYKRLIGSNDTSWGWCLKTKKIYHDSRKFRNGISYPKELDEKLKIPESFYMLLDMDRGTLSFQVLDDFLGVAFSGLRGLELYPVVSAVWGHCEVTLKYIGSHEFGKGSVCGSSS